MKKLSILILSILSVVALSSCDKGDMGPVANTSDPGSPSITSPESGQSYTLNEDQADDTLMTMEWSNPDYGFSAAPSYSIEMDSTGHQFEDPTQIASVTGNTFSVTVGEMNSILLGAGFPFGEPISLEFRVIASLSDSLEQQVSDPVNLTVTAYSVCQFCPEIYVPGSYQGASGYGSNWTPADAPSLATVSGQDVYEGYVYMANADNQFKFTADQSWATNWGTSGTEGELEAPGNNIVASSSGYYKVNVDINSMSYSLTNTQWGVIGSATADGWNSDQDMTYDPQNKVWTITTDLSSGEIKFRANDAWDINYGDNSGDGTLELNGSNIAVGSAGTYTITLDLSSTPYSYSLTQQ